VRTEIISNLLLLQVRLLLDDMFADMHSKMQSVELPVEESARPLFEDESEREDVMQKLNNLAKSRATFCYYEIVSSG
jgi:hypothetical protein